LTIRLVGEPGRNLPDLIIPMEEDIVLMKRMIREKLLLIQSLTMLLLFEHILMVGLLLRNLMLAVAGRSRLRFLRSRHGG
jgi:hypothetical protein